MSQLIAVVLVIVVWFGITKIYPDRRLYPTTLREVLKYAASGLLLILLQIALISTRCFGLLDPGDMHSIPDVLLVRIIDMQTSLVVAGYMTIALALVGIVLLGYKRLRERFN
jgi:hypothetical protein